MEINLKKKIISITNNILKNTLLIMLFALKLPLNIERAITKQRAIQKRSWTSEVKTNKFCYRKVVNHIYDYLGSNREKSMHPHIHWGVLICFISLLPFLRALSKFNALPTIAVVALRGDSKKIFITCSIAFKSVKERQLLLLH